MHQVFISAFEAVTAAGFGARAFWQKLLKSESSVLVQDHRWCAPLREEAASQIQAFARMQSFRNYDRSTLLAIAASRLLSEQVAVSKDAACVFGSSRGATETIERELGKFLQGKAVHAAASPLSTLGGLSASVASDLALRGPVVSLSSACATGLISVGTAYAYLRAGLAEAAIAGGSEASLTPFTFAQLAAAKVYAKRPASELYPYMPFHEARSGMVLGEGAAAIYLSSVPSQTDYATITGYASTHEVAGLTGISVGGEGLKDACAKAINLAGISPHDLSFVVAHGAGTKKGDESELEAYRQLFRNELPPITSSKWAVGHVLGASGVLSVILACQMLKDKSFVSLPYASMFGQDKTPREFRYALVTALGFGGNAVAMVLESV